MRIRFPVTTLRLIHPYSLAIAVGILTLIGAWQTAAAQGGNIAKVAEIVRSDWEARNPDSKIPLLVQSQPKLQEDVISLQQLNKPSKIDDFRLVEFYVVTNGLYEIQNGRIRATTILLDRETPYWLVATDPEGETYQLQGFKDTSGEFNRLVSNLRLSISKPDDAIDVLYLYLQLCDRRAFNSLVGDRMSLQAVATADFRARFSRGESDAKYRSWSSKALPKAAKISPPQAVSQFNGFAVTFWWYDFGDLVKEAFSISREGVVTRERRFR